MTTERYDELLAELGAAGLHAHGVEVHDSWHRVCVASQRLPNGGLTGNSFWLSCLSTGWHLGTWGGSIYRLPDANQIVALCIRWLSRNPAKTLPDFDEHLRHEFGLLAISDEEFERASNSDG